MPNHFHATEVRYGQPEDKTRARDAGFDAHLTKPANLQTLRELMATANVQS